MPNAGNLTAGNRFFGLFVGDSGGGKTPSACSFVNAHKEKRVYVFDFDGRMESLLNTPWIDRSRIDFDYYPPVVGKGTGTSNFQKLNDKFEAFQVQLSTGSCPYNTIILDSLKSQTFAFICDALQLTHGGINKSGGIKGRTIGTLKMAGPEDYGFESTGTQQVISFLRSLPIQNVIVTCHIIDKYGKENPDDPLSPSVVKGEKLALRDKLSATIPGDFNHVFRFERKFEGGQNHIKVNFWSDLARTVYPNLPAGDIDISGKNFYDVLMSYVNKTELPK